MRKQQRTDAEINAAIDRNFRINVQGLAGIVGGCCLLAAVSLAAIMTGNENVLLGPWFQIPIAIAFVGWIAFVFVRHAKNPLPREANEDRIIRQRIDARQRRLRWLMLFNVLAGFGCALSDSYAFRHLGNADRIFGVFGGVSFVAVLSGVGLVLPFLMFSLPVIYGTAFLSAAHSDATEDELSRALRARALRVGYVTLLLAISAALVAILYRPSLAVAILPWVLFAGFAIPSLYYVFLDWRAGRNSESAGRDEI